MIKIVNDRPRTKTGSVTALANHLRYLANPLHPDHIGKIILKGRNYNCCGPAPDDFVKAVQLIEEQYLHWRRGKCGKRTGSLWDEVIYRAPDDSFLSERERDYIETKIISSLCRNTACHTRWHIHEKNRTADLHIILATKTLGFPPQITLREALGRDGGDHSYAALDRLDSEIVAEINRNRPKEKHILSKVQAGRRNARRAIGKKRPLASEIAHEARNTKVTDDNIESVIRALGYTVTKRTERHISVKFGQGGTVARKRPRRFDLPKLLAEVEAIQMRQSDPGDLNSADKRECASKRPLQGIRGAWESTTMAL